MNLDAFRIICDLVEQKNFSRTAQMHGITQSAVSQQVANLEEEFKCIFINRKKRPFSLTVEGQLLYRTCRDIVDRYERFQSELASQARSTSIIKISAIFSIGMHTLQPYVKKFMEKFPKVNLKVEYQNADQIYEGVLNGNIDIGVLAAGKKNRQVDIFPFVNEPLVLVCNPTHALASFHAVDIHKIDGLVFVAIDKDVPTRIWIDRILEEYNVKPNISLEFDNIETIKRAVEIGAGVSILPETTIQAELSNGTLKAISFVNEKFYRPTSVIIRKDKTLTQAGRYLLELLQQKVCIQ